MQELRVLVVEDVAVMRDALRELLEGLGIKDVALAADAAGVAAALARGPVALAFVAAEQIRTEHLATLMKASCAAAHLVVTATRDDADTARVAATVGARAVLVKPWTAAQVGAVVARCRRESP
jgi:AmiR/NasT family two-component response regulator